MVNSAIPGIKVAVTGVGGGVLLAVGVTEGVGVGVGVKVGLDVLVGANVEVGVALGVKVAVTAGGVPPWKMSGKNR